MTDLSRVLAETLVNGENPAFSSGHFDPSRHMALSPKLFFKKIRPAGSNFEYHDLVCELFCSRLAGTLSLPVPAYTPVTIPQLGFGLLGAFVGQKTMAGTTLQNIINADKLPAMLVFEQLVLNVDDKADHFRVRELPGGRCEFYSVDHGHTLHAWRPELQDPSTVESAPVLLLPSSAANEYRVQNYAQLASFVTDIGSRAADATGPVLGQMFRDLEAESRAGDLELQRVVAEWAKHEAIIGKIICLRSRNLDQIVRLKCQQAAIRIDPEQTVSSLVGVGVSQ